jgi:5'-nucleotidase / UDP-sugar diphosphatase
MFKFIIVSDTHGADLSRLYTAISQQIEKDRAGSPAIKHILVMAGDVFSTNKLLSVISNGNFDIETMSALAMLFPPDGRLFIPGNHDYSYGEDQLIKLITQAGFQVVISNTTFKKESKLPFTEQITLADGDAIVRFGGLMTAETLNNANARKFIAKINTEYKFEKPQPDVVISHLGLGDDLRRADSGHIFGGHTHSEGIYPLPRSGDTGNRYVINGGAFAEVLVIAPMEAKNKEIIAPTVVPTVAFEPNPIITAITEAGVTILESKLELPAGKLASRACAFASGIPPSGLDLNDKEVKETTNHLRIVDTVMTRTAADALASRFDCIALFPAAGIRGNFKPGQTLTYAELFESFAAGNKIVKLQVTGKELIEGLAKGILHSYRYWRGRGRILHPSRELAYEYDINQGNPGDVIRSVTIGGQPVDPDKIYDIVTTDWAASYCFPADKIIPLAADAEAKADPYVIAKTVAAYVDGRTLTEAFSERIRCPQSLQEQEDLLPTLDRAKSEIRAESFNIEYHRALYEAHEKKAPVVVKGMASLVPSDSPLREGGEAVLASPLPLSSSSTSNFCNFFKP